MFEFLSSPVRLGRPRLTAPRGAGARISWTADGEEVWFETDTELAPAAEAAVTAFLYPAMRRGRGLTIDAPLDPVFLGGLATTRRLGEEIMGFRGGRVVHRGEETSPGGGPGLGLFFTGGVDSFHALRGALGRVTHMVYVEGFDVDLEDRPRLETVTDLVHRVAAECGVGVFILRTNLRTTRVFRRLSWILTHGSALAAVGHLLVPSLRSVLIGSDGAPGQPLARLGIEGDPARSSSAMAVVHADSALSRLEKVQGLVDWPLAMDNLRVCWLNQVPGLNCGVCEKCLRTRALVVAAGGPPDPPTLGGQPLANAIATLPATYPANAAVWRSLLEPSGLPDGPVRVVVADFVARCDREPPDRGFRRLRRKIARALGRVFQRIAGLARRP